MNQPIPANNQAVTIDQPPVPQELEYPFSLDRKDGKMLFMWFFIPVRMNPSDVFNFILILEIFYGFMHLMFALCIGQRKVHEYIELVFIWVNFIVYGFILFTVGIVLQRNWLKWFKQNKLRAYGEFWFWSTMLCMIPNILFFLIGFAVNTHKFWSGWNTYKDNEDVWKPKEWYFFVVGDDQRSIGSYAEKVTRHAYDLGAAYTWLGWSTYMLYLTFAGNYALHEMHKNKNLIKCKVISESRETLLIDGMRTSLMSRAANVEIAGRNLVVGGVVNNYPIEFEDEEWENNDFGPEVLPKQSAPANPLNYAKADGSKIRDPKAQTTGNRPTKQLTGVPEPEQPIEFEELGRSPGSEEEIGISITHKVKSSNNLRRTSTTKKNNDHLLGDDAGLKIANKQAGEGRFKLPSPEAEDNERPGTAAGKKKTKKAKKPDGDNVNQHLENSPDFDLKQSENFEDEI